MQSTPSLTDRIEQQRTRQGMSLRTLADTAAIPRVTLKRRLADPRSFTLAELARIFDALGIKASAINVRDVA